MLKHMLKVIISLVLIFSLYENAIAVYALPPYVSLSLERREQEKSNWCWAAVAQMAGEYYGASHLQAEIVYQIKGNVDNKGANDSQVIQAINYALPPGRSAVVEGVKTETFLTTKLAQGYIIPIKMEWNSGGAHSVIISGYDTSGKLTITDPLKNCSAKISYRYSDLKNGTSIQSGTGRYTQTRVIQ